MGQKQYRMSEQLKSGVCEKCFSFQGVCERTDPAIPNSTIAIPYPICASTLHESVGYCTKTPLPSTTPSSASQKSRPISKKSIAKSKKIMVTIGDNKYEQGHFNDYLKQLKSKKGVNK